MSVDDQIAIKEIVKKSGSSFFWGMNVLNSKKKRAMFSIYAFDLFLYSRQNVNKPALITIVAPIKIILSMVSEKIITPITDAKTSCKYENGCITDACATCKVLTIKK